MSYMTELGPAGTDRPKGYGGVVGLGAGTPVEVGDNYRVRARREDAQGARPDHGGRRRLRTARGESTRKS